MKHRVVMLCDGSGRKLFFPVTQKDLYRITFGCEGYEDSNKGRTYASVHRSKI